MVQIVHYPLFAHVGPEEFRTFEALHTKWITYVVAMPMLIELFASGLWIIERDRRISNWVPWAGAVLVMVLWFSTFAFSVRFHGELMGGFKEEAWHGLVVTNWIRTIAWSARGMVLVYALYEVWGWETPGEALTSSVSSQKIGPAVGE